MRLVKRNLIREGDYMKINIHAGHNPDGRIACGAVGLIKESTEARKVKNEVIRLLRNSGHTVYDCTVDNGTSQNDVLSTIVDKCNNHEVDLDISIHFNSGRNDKKGDDATGGTEVYVYSTSSKAKSAAEKICKAIAALGYKNRGVKTSTSLYVIKHTNSPSMLIECCFVDDKDDIEIYNYKTMAEAIVQGITGKKTTSKSYKVKVSSQTLNVRLGPSSKYPIHGKVKRNEVYTIVDTENNWGKLKSGAGWISLKYTEKVKE